MPVLKISVIDSLPYMHEHNLVGCADSANDSIKAKKAQKSSECDYY